MTYSVASFRRSACLFCLFLFVTAFSAPAKAGCPTDIFPAVETDQGYVDWTPVTQSFTLASGCVVEVEYCRRNVPGLGFQYYIDEVKATGAGCPNLYWIDVFNEVREVLFNDASINPGPCTQPKIIVTLYTGMCISFHTYNGDPVCRPCPGAYCAKACEVCINSIGQREVSGCTFSVVGNANCETQSYLEEVTFYDIANEFPGDFYTCYMFDCEVFD